MFVYKNPANIFCALIWNPLGRNEMFYLLFWFVKNIHDSILFRLTYE